MLLTSPLLSEVVVLGKLDKDGGEYPYAVIYVDPDARKALENETGHAMGPEEMKAAVKAEIHRCTAQAAVYKIPQGFEISQEELPKTSTRKVKRFMFASAK